MPRISKRRESYSHRIQDELKEDRRVEGDKRKEAWEGLTMIEKLQSLAERPGDSRKQVFRLLGREITAQEALILMTTEGEE